MSAVNQGTWPFGAKNKSASSATKKCEVCSPTHYIANNFQFPSVTTRGDERIPTGTKV